MFSVTSKTARRVVQTCLLVLSAALATVSIGAFAQQGGNKSANSQQHAPGADYSHRYRSPAVIPDIPGLGPGGRPNFGGCDAADATIGRNGCGERTPPPIPPPCNDPNASNRGAALPCVCKDGFKWNGSACQDTICRDDKAPNVGKPLPCDPPCPAGQVPLAGQCEIDPIGDLCLDPKATNYGGPLPCLYGAEPQMCKYESTSHSDQDSGLSVTIGPITQGEQGRMIKVSFSYSFDQYEPGGGLPFDGGENEGVINVYRQVGNGSESLWLTVPVGGGWGSGGETSYSDFSGQGQKAENAPAGQTIRYRAEVGITKGDYRGHQTGHTYSGAGSVEICSTEMM